MTAEELLRLLGQVDGDLIQEAEVYRPARRPRSPYWGPVAGGVAAACLLAVFLTHVPSGGNSSSGSAAPDAGGTGGSFAWDSQISHAQEDGASSAGAESAPAAGEEAPGDVLTTPAGEYILTGEVLSALPEDSRQVGVLFPEGEESRSGLYTSRADYAGCLLWEGPDGELYVQLSGGGYALARMEGEG